MTLRQNFAPSLSCILMHSTSLFSSFCIPKSKYTDLFLTDHSSRMLSVKASKNSTAYIASKGRFCHSTTSYRTETVTELI